MRTRTISQGKTREGVLSLYLTKENRKLTGNCALQYDKFDAVNVSTALSQLGKLQQKVPLMSDRDAIVHAVWARRMT